MKKKLILLFFIIFYSSISFSQYEFPGKSGLYYPKKLYSGSELPDYSNNLNRLPQPVLTDNPEFIELYNKSWELTFLHFKKPPKNSPFVSDFLDEAFSPNIFQWDSFFMIMFARYAHHIFPVIQSLDNFYCRQYENGYICREIQESDGEDYVFMGREHTINPPLFSWAEVENYRISGDKSRFRDILLPIEKYVDWLEKYRKRTGTMHNLYWQTGLGSGMDNSPRSGSGWIDISAQMVMMYNDLAFITSELGMKAKSDEYKNKAKSLSIQINLFMWDETDGIYYDIDDNNKKIKVKTLAGFWPMIAGICTKEQAEKMVYQLKNPKTFWRLIPFPSLSFDSPDYKADGSYWLGGVWAPTNVMVIKGLEKYGFNEFATLATEEYLKGMYKVFKKTGTIWENYSPESYSRGMPSQPDFVGWSGCGPVELLIENILGFSPDGANKKLIWRLNRIDYHGIKNLHFDKINTSLFCEKRETINSKANITVESDNPYELIVILSGKENIFKVSQGKNIISLP